jgi:hypothetical protein
VAAAGVVGLALVAGVAAWAAAHPREGRPAPANPAPTDEALSQPEVAPAVEPAAATEEAPPPAPPAPTRSLTLPVQPLPRPPEDVVEASEACAGQTYGTGVTFLSDPAEAGRRAGRSGKLLFVLHISGNFEEAQFT